MDKTKKSVFVGKGATIVSGKCSGITGMVIGADSAVNTVEIDVEGATIFTTYDNITQMVLLQDREFRGKAKMGIEELNELGIKHVNGWVYGSLTGNYIVGNIIEATDDYLAFEWFTSVDPTTVGRYTRLKDWNGRIYEGDIVKWDDRSDGMYWRVAVVYYDQFGRLCYRFTPQTTTSSLIGTVWYQGQFAYAETTHIDLEVIGNIYDNPELLRRDKNARD